MGVCECKARFQNRAFLGDSHSITRDVAVSGRLCAAGPRPSHQEISAIRDSGQANPLARHGNPFHGSGEQGSLCGSERPVRGCQESPLLFKQRLEFLVELRHDLEEVAHDAEISLGENRGFRVLVDGHDHL
jgi:hypothetical protein